MLENALAAVANPIFIESIAKNKIMLELAKLEKELEGLSSNDVRVYDPRR